MRLIYLFLIFVFDWNVIYSQGIISSGYISNSGAPFMTLENASLTNNGTWVKATESLIFSGTLANELKGAATSYHNISISNTGGITLNTSNLQTIDNLTVNAGGLFSLANTSKLTINTLLTNNNGVNGLVLKSDINGSGSLLHTTAGVSATVLQYHTDSALTRYHIVSSPISNATAVVFKFTGAGPYLYGYDPNGSPSRWVNIIASSTSLQVGLGYLINFNLTTVDRTVLYSGTMNTGAVNLTLSPTGSGYNLIGNPYPCAIDWNVNDGAGWSRTNIDNTFSVWLHAKGSYGTYQKGVGGTNGLTNIIQAGQGFFVHTTSGTALIIGNGVKTHNNAILKSAIVPPPLIKLHISSNTNSYSDEAILWFSNDATGNYDWPLEAQKILSMNTESSQIYTVTNDKQDLAINALPFGYTNDIPLYFKCAKDGRYNLEINDNNLSDSVFLTDLLTTKRELLSQHNYEFDALKTDTSRRFILNFKQVENNTTALENKGNSSVKRVLMYVESNILHIKNLSNLTIEGEVFITNLLGQAVYHKHINVDSEYIQPIAGTGIYTVSFYVKNNVYKEKVVIQ